MCVRAERDNNLYKLNQLSWQVNYTYVLAMLDGVVLGISCYRLL